VLNNHFNILSDYEMMVQCFDVSHRSSQNFLPAHLLAADARRLLRWNLIVLLLRAILRFNQRGFGW